MGNGDQPASAAGPETAIAGDTQLVEALRRGDENAFLALVERYHGALQRVAFSYVGSWALAEEAAQETWIGVMQGIDRFEGRASLKTWIFRILSNRARTLGTREARSISFADLTKLSDEVDQPPGDGGVFVPDGQPDAGWWLVHPAHWGSIPEEQFLAVETRALIDQVIAALPPTQRLVITLRDIEGWSAEEVRQLLVLSDANQRVLLHRARTKVRRALELHFAES